MSAFVVHKATIDALVTIHVALEREADGSNEPVELSQGLAAYDKLGAMLWRENHRSVNARYSEKKRTPSYKFVALPVSRPLTPTVLSRALGALHCYEYQACEHATWPTSKASAWCKALRAKLEPRVPHAPSRYTEPAWQERPVYTGWEITHDDAATALVDPKALRYDGGVRAKRDPNGRCSHGHSLNATEPCRQCWEAGEWEGEKPTTFATCGHGVPIFADTGRPIRCDRCEREEGEWEASAS